MWEVVGNLLATEGQWVQEPSADALVVTGGMACWLDRLQPCLKAGWTALGFPESCGQGQELLASQWTVGCSRH